jgi:hypothetical protein
MTNKEKAVEFLRLMKQGDSRCDVLIMMLSHAYSISWGECLARINAIADE